MGVVNDVLDFTAIEGNRVELEVSEFSAARLAQDAVALMRPMAEQKGLDLLLWVGPLPRRLTGNPTRLQQVLVNLLSNAIKVTEQGEVRLDLSATRAQAASWRLTCAVTDSSAGIEQAALARLRDAIDDDRLIDTSDTSAAGMRVSIAARLLKQVSGDLRIEIEPGKGCRIIVSVVLDEAGSDAIARIEMPTKPVVLDQLRVLVAEDNPVNQTLAMAVLGRFGIQAELARDGNEALAAVRQRPFDIVLMDMRMPNLDGLEATRAIRALPDRQGRPWIIAVTANAFDQDRQQCLEAGMNDFLPKPFNQAALRAALMNARLPG
jgi:CheY-like chemotaxis protein